MHVDIHVYRNEVNQAIRNAKCDYYTTLLEKAYVKIAFSTTTRSAR